MAATVKFEDMLPMLVPPSSRWAEAFWGSLGETLADEGLVSWVVLGWLSCVDTGNGGMLDSDDVDVPCVSLVCLDRVVLGLSSVNDVVLDDVLVDGGGVVVLEEVEVEGGSSVVDGAGTFMNESETSLLGMDSVVVVFRPGVRGSVSRFSRSSSRHRI
ncbi:hypothetical protein RRF57_002441 [Xylaria bambusicola]|uniref:Uncharacterized protein n=1 Tax=Xylaria bambusicola TaxID=326684 RepID=A0AAN7UKB9_9PEZI